ncbi:MAG: four helix bundle protein [Candidatus Omnitrophica bacterium]|nr:four helix bundle protein [Candidatus Omnitrophota bacterium]
MSFSFEKLDVYSKAIDYADKVYKISKNFPDSEIYGLTSQIRRAAVSISSNIAEGSGRFHRKEFIQYLRIARSSLYESVALMEISFRQSYVSKLNYNELIILSNELAKMINGLINSLDKR